MRKFILLLFLVFSCITQPIAKNWYVSTSSSGNASADSWANSKTYWSLSTSTLSPGDTVFFDGGPDSLEYSSSSYVNSSIAMMITSVGTPEDKIVFTRGKDAGHNGIPVFKNMHKYVFYFNNARYVELSYIKGVSYSTLELEYKPIVYLYGANSTDIDIIHNEFDYTYGTAIQVNNCDNMKIKNNYIYTNALDSGSAEYQVAVLRQNDAITLKNTPTNPSTNLEIAYNTIIARTSVPANFSGPHRDMFQLNYLNIKDGGTSSVHHNFVATLFEDDSCITTFFESPNVQGTLLVYDNIFAKIRNGADLFNFDQANEYYPAHIKIFNNTMVRTNSKYISTQNSNFSGTEIDSITFKNNLVYNESGVFASMNASGAYRDFDYNIYELSGTGFVSDASWTQWTTTYGQDAHSQNGDFTLVDNDFNTFSETPSDYMLAPGSSGIDEGTNLSTIFTTDYRDSSRIGVTWDAGAFEGTGLKVGVDNTSPNLVGALVINPTAIELTFSESLENSSASNKINYSINNGIGVNSVALSADGKKVTLSTAQNTANQTYTVVVSNVKDLAGNIISLSNNSAQYSYVGDSTSPEVTSASLTNPTTLVINFSEAMDPALSVVSSKYVIGNGITITSTSLSTDGKKVTLNTSQHTANQNYTVTVSNVIDLTGNTILSTKNTAPYSYVGDTTPPEVASASLTNPTTLVINFSEAMDPALSVVSSKYVIGNGITITSTSLSTDGKKVTLNTSQHTANQNYTVTVSNVIDLAGNTILSTKNSAPYSYVGDTTPPNLLSAAVLNSTTIEILFSEALETGSAQTKLNYSVSNGIVVNSAALSSEKKNVTLSTTQHITNQDYTVTVTNVKDLAGNIISLTNSAQYSFVDNTVGNLKSNVKIFLQGPYQSNNMITELSDNEFIPVSQPYNAVPCLYNGSESLSSSLGSSSSTVVDWVLVELRSPQNPAQVISRRAGLLRNDGRIMEPDGSLGVTFKNVLYGSYYISIQHRNHLSVITSVPVLFSPDNSLYDFTNSLTKAYGQNAMTEITAGVFGMFSGDGDGNGIINDKDRNEIWSNQNGNMGYLNGDFNLDSGVTIKDINDYWNLNEGKVTQVP